MSISGIFSGALEQF